MNYITSNLMVLEAIENLASQENLELRGAIFTRSEVVNFILDLSGYTVNRELYRMKVIEPSFGRGDFLIPIVDRLLQSWKKLNIKENPEEKLLGALRAVEVHKDTFNDTRLKVLNKLYEYGIKFSVANKLVDTWLIQGDFLLMSFEEKFDFILGNPPYVRQELISEPLLKEYRKKYRTLYDRADLYIPFIECSLNMLSIEGVLGYICADRWMKNKYGGPLREFISENYHVKVYVDMMNANAFHNDVDAYPAIFIIERGKQGPIRKVNRPEINDRSLRILANKIKNKKLSCSETDIEEVVNITNGTEPWLFETSDQMGLLRRIESQFPTIEEVGCKVGIGVATGADKVFIGNFDELDVETDRKLRLVTTRDIISGEIKWQKLGVINPFNEDGGLVDLKDYPLLRRYLEKHKNLVLDRHCAQKSPAKWYRTIDRINPDLLKQPKLLIPDIKGKANIVFDKGEYYPHHNLYFFTSSSWPLRALQAVLLSQITRVFLTTYSTKMRGGYFRFQAQYLRRIRIPNWQDVSKVLRKELNQAAIKNDLQACNRAAFKLYGLNKIEESIARKNGENNGS